jgi:hypothetical protein
LTGRMHPYVRHVLTSNLIIFERVDMYSEHLKQC